MARIQFTDVQARPTEFLDLTSVTLDAFQQFVPPFETAFQAHLAAWRRDGKPRIARRCTVYTNCPLPTPEARLFFMVVYLQTYALQVVQGRLFGMGQSKGQPGDPRAPARAAHGPAHPRRCPAPLAECPCAAARRHTRLRRLP